MTCGIDDVSRLPSTEILPTLINRDFSLSVFKTMAQIIPFKLEPAYSSDEEVPTNNEEEEGEVLVQELSEFRLKSVEGYVVVFVRKFS